MSENRRNNLRMTGNRNENLRRASDLDNWNRRRFEQEVAEEFAAGRGRDRRRRNQDDAMATHAGPKSNRQTGNYGRDPTNVGRERRNDRC